MDFSDFGSEGRGLPTMALPSRNNYRGRLCDKIIWIYFVTIIIKHKYCTI